VRGRGRRLVRALPPPLRQLLGLDDDGAVGSRRLEIGGGRYARAGYIHVDVDPGAGHLEAVAPAWSLPFPDSWAEEVLAIHSLEHVHPRQLLPTLSEWRRVLAPGGRIRVHVPNGPALMERLGECSIDEKWPIMGSLLGMYCGPEVRSPEGLRARSDHQIIFDAPLLRWALERSGFTEVEDRTDEVVDRHTEAWRDLVPRYSLVMDGVK